MLSSKHHQPRPTCSPSYMAPPHSGYRPEVASCKVVIDVAQVVSKTARYCWRIRRAGRKRASDGQSLRLGTPVRWPETGLIPSDAGANGTAGGLPPAPGPISPTVSVRLWDIAMLNKIETMLWLTDVLERVVSGRTKANELARLLSWAWKAERLAATAHA
jgi:hypothetical protein